MEFQGLDVDDFDRIGAGATLAAKIHLTQLERLDRELKRQDPIIETWAAVKSKTRGYIYNTTAGGVASFSLLTPDTCALVEFITLNPSKYPNALAVLKDLEEIDTEEAARAILNTFEAQAREFELEGLALEPPGVVYIHNINEGRGQLSPAYRLRAPVAYLLNGDKPNFRDDEHQTVNLTYYAARVLGCRVRCAAIEWPGGPVELAGALSRALWGANRSDMIILSDNINEVDWEPPKPVGRNSSSTILMRA